MKDEVPRTAGEYLAHALRILDVAFYGAEKSRMTFEVAQVFRPTVRKVIDDEHVVIREQSINDPPSDESRAASNQRFHETIHGSRIFSARR